jgi:hypothetical protein
MVSYLIQDNWFNVQIVFFVEIIFSSKWDK